MTEPIDEFAQRIMERTRERREMLAKKMADTSPRRKRGSPRNSNLQDITNTPREPGQDDSPNKRTCVRSVERSVHDDTPAVKGVKSRLDTLAETRKQWLQGDGENMDNENSAPLPPQPCFTGAGDENEADACASPLPGRRNRLAALAQNINQWEDDLSHPTIKAEEKPTKKLWQRPAPRPEDSAPVVPGDQGPEGPSKPPRTYQCDGSSERQAAALPKFVSPSRKPLEDVLSPPKSSQTSSCHQSASSPRKAVSSITVTLSSAATGATRTASSNSVTSLRERQPSPVRGGANSVTSLRERQPSPMRGGANSVTSLRERQPSPVRGGANSVTSLRERQPSPYSGMHTTSPGPSSVGGASPPGHRSVSPGNTLRAHSPGRPLLGNAVPRPYGSPAKLATSSALNTGTAHASPVPVVQPQSCTEVTAPVSDASASHSSRSSRRSDVFEPTRKPVADRMQAWRMRIEGGAAPSSGPAAPGASRPAVSALERVQTESYVPEDDPLNMSIHSRRNVWESKISETEGSGAEHTGSTLRAPSPGRVRAPSPGRPGQQTSSVRAPSPGRLGQQTSAVRAPSPGRPGQHQSSTSVRAPSPGRPGQQQSHAVRAPSPGRPGYQSSAVRAPSPGRPQDPSPTAVSPLKKSPGHVGQATQALHERLNAFANNWQSNEIAERARLQRDRDMEVLNNRWKGGLPAAITSDVTTSGDDFSNSTAQQPESKPSTATGVPPAPAPPAEAPSSGKTPQTAAAQPVSEHRQYARNAMRRDFEEKLQLLGFALESDAEHSGAHKAIVDLTPYRERDKHAKTPSSSAVTGKPPKPASVTVSERKVTEVKFNDTPTAASAANHDSHSLLTSTVCFTPGKPSVAYAQHTAGGKTPSIYSLIKKTGGPTAYQPPSTTTPAAKSTVTTPAASASKDSFSDDSFDESSTADRAAVKRPMHFGGQQHGGVQPCSQLQHGGSQSSLTSALSDSTSQYTETQTDSQNDESLYSETEDQTEATNTEASEESEYSDEEEEEEEGGDVSGLLDEALEECEQPPAVSHPREVAYSNPQAAPRHNQARPQDSDVESTASNSSSGGGYRGAPCNKRVKFASPCGDSNPHPRGGYSSSGGSGSEATERGAPAAPGGVNKHGVQMRVKPAQRTGSSSGTESEREERPYSIDMYRNSKAKMNAPVPKMTIVRHSNSHQLEMAKQDPLPYTPTKSAKERLTELQERVNQEQTVIMQTSKALNQCCLANSAFAGSQEAVECHKLLLIACKKREAYISEMHRLRQGYDSQERKGPQGSLTITDIRLPLKQTFVQNIGGPNDLSQHYFLLLVRHRDHVVFTQMVGSHDAMVRGGTLEFPNMIKFGEVSQDFRLEVEVYGMSVTREDPNSKSAKKKKKLKSGAAMASPGGPGAVRSTNFVLVGHMSLDAGALGRTHFSLEGVPFSSPLHGTVHLRLRCLIESSVTERGFLTMFEDVSGFGAWHRRWFVLKDTRLSYWKYPDDEKNKEALGWMELKQVVTDQVGLIPRDICARPNTFELITVRRQTRGEEDSLTTRCYNTMTTTKHWLSADTKEERLFWCSRLNDALTNIRTWHSDALRPITRREFVQPYNPYADKADEKSCVIPFNPHDQQSAV